MEIVDQTELESVIHPGDCIIAVNNKDINTREREPGDIDTSRSLLEATIQTGTPCPVSASAIIDPRIAAELVDCRLQGAPDRDRSAARRQHRGLDRGIRATPGRADGACNCHPTTFLMSQTATRSIADHFAEQATRRPDAPALIWDGAPISYAELQWLADAAFAELEGARLPEDRPIGVRAKKSPEAIALILACLRSGRPFLLPSIELAPETLAQLFAQAGTSQVISPHGPRSESAASLRALVDDARSAPERSGDQSGRRRAVAVACRSC